MRKYVKFTIKNWKTGETISTENKYGFAKKNRINPIKFYTLWLGRGAKQIGNFCLPETEVPIFKLKNLRTRKVHTKYTIQDCCKLTKLSSPAIKRIIKGERSKEWCSPEWKGAVPRITINGKNQRIFERKRKLARQIGVSHQLIDYYIRTGGNLDLEQLNAKRDVLA